jgi:SAM-dependent methyltransferase
MSTSIAWDERYAGGDFQFGEAPNRYLESLGPWLRPGMRALALGDGEGRNGAWLAGQGLAVTSLDWSPVASAKAAALAAARKVAMATVTADAAAWTYPQAGFDLVAWIFLHLPPEDRAAAAAGALRSLAPAGCWRWNASPPPSRAGAAAGRKCRNCSGPARSSRSCSAGCWCWNCWKAPSIWTKARATRAMRRWYGRCCESRLRPDPGQARRDNGPAS